MSNGFALFEKTKIMDILKLANDWARAELFSTRFFILFAILFIAASIGFKMLGKTDLAKAYFIPTLVAGVLLLIVGIGLIYSNTTRLNNFEKAHKENPSEFVQSEIDRAVDTVGQFSRVFKVIPLIIIAASLLIMFVDKALWRAIGVTTIAMMICILIIDGLSDGRIKDYHKDLLSQTDKE